MISSSELLFNAKYADFYLECDGDTIPIHRAIVCPQSEVIEAALFESQEKSKSRRLQFKSFDASAIKCMLRYMYTNDYNTEIHQRPVAAGIPATPASAHADLSVESCILTAIAHVHVYAIAVRYDVSGLRDIALRKFTSARVSPEHPDFFQLVHCICQYTASGDSLRMRFIAGIVNILQKTPAHGAFLRELTNQAKLQPFAIELLTEYLRAANEVAVVQKGVINELQAKITSMQQDLVDVEPSICPSPMSLSTMWEYPL